ncbi:unnamed protein product [Rotaria magnacalcarata]|uniref:Ion transport domain-containing protein n=1 Tax=Rotaria magnacalcarata TaxID=392030 RepID=A0A817A3F0_9BILA|nr:unnamed protein product [Rotaria magnacalcarata]
MINKNILHTSLPTVVNISNRDSCICEAGRLFNACGSSCVLSDLYYLEEREENKLPFPDFVEKVFCCLRQATPIRYQCLKLMTWPWFERISMLIILLNCITLAMYQPCAYNTGTSRKCNTVFCISLQATESFIFAFFTMEMCIKMIAMGIFGKGAYLAESWNRLDCIIVLTGLVELLIPGDNLSLSAIRTVRVLRPLRTINRVPSMRMLVMLLLDTLPMLGNVLLLCFFVFFIFGIVGVQLWKGLLRNRCFLQLNTTMTDNYAFDDFPFQPFYIPSDKDSFICSDPSSSGMRKCSQIPKLNRNNMTCELDFRSMSSSLINQTINGCINWNQYYQLCKTSNENPFFGSISFDNIAVAWLAIFQIITLENWTIIMYYLQDAHSFWDWIYFVFLIIFGSYVMMNLCLVAISGQFSVTKKRVREKMLAEQTQLSSSTINQQDSCWEQIIEHFRQLPKRVYQRFRIFWKNDQKKCDKVKETSHQKLTAKANVLPSSNGDLVSSTSLINLNHQSHFHDLKSQSILAANSLSNLIGCATDTCEISSRSKTNNQLIENHQEKNENLEFEQPEQEIEIKNRTDNSYQDKVEEKSKSRQSCCCSCLAIIIKLISRLVSSKYFDRIVFLVIITNSLSMAIEHHEQPQLLTKILEYSNYVFIALFTIEMLFKIIAKTFWNYIKDPFNIFDSGIVLISIIELYWTKNSGLSILRTFRLLRVLKLARFMPTLRRQLIVMVKALDSAAAFLLLLILFIFIFSVLGMHLFGGKFCTLEAFNTTSREKIEMECRCCACIEWNLLKISTDLKDLTCTEERENFNSLLFALLTVFQILTQEDWNEILYNAMKNTKPWAALYFIALIVIVNYILVNLLVAIVVENFQNETEENNNHSIDKTQTMITNNIEISKHFNKLTTLKLNNDGDTRQQDPITGDIRFEITTQESRNTRSCISRVCGERIFECLKKRENHSLYLFSPSNRLRKAFQRLLAQKSFDYIILFFIVFNSIILAMERPSISPESCERKILIYINYIFTSIFTIEMMIKVIAHGLIIGPRTYLHTGWNSMDGCLVVISITDIFIMIRGSFTPSTEQSATSHMLSMLRVFRLLRTLRAVTVINRAPGLKLVMDTLLSSLKSIGHIIIICCVFFIIFGILGVQLFKGKFYYCEGPFADNVTTRQQCEAMADHRWKNQHYNFDNLFHALLTLFVLSSKDGWVQIMHNGIDAVNVDMQPIKNYSEANLIYFISFISIVGFFVLSMFVGVVVESFQDCQTQQELEKQAKRVKDFGLEQHLTDDLPYHANFLPWRKFLHDLCINKYFDLTIGGIIVVNVFTMSLEFYPSSPRLENFPEYCNYVFTVIFLLEFIWKIVALGPLRYFKDKWYQLDAFIVILSAASIIIEKVLNENILPINPTIIRVIRILRIARIFKLLKIANGLQTLMHTVMKALPQVGNLSLLFFLFVFIFATLGVELFGKLECDDEQPCTSLNKHANFKNFGIALLTLFRVATGDNWSGIMKDTMRPNDSSAHAGNHRFLTIISPLYFIAFVVMTQFVLINIVIAVLLKKLEDATTMIEEDAVSDEDKRRQYGPNVQHDGGHVEKLLLDVNALHVKGKIAKL